MLQNMKSAEITHPLIPFLGTAVSQWLRCCATNRRIAGSIPDVFSGIFHWHISSWSHYGPGVHSASNRNEYQECFLGVKAAGAWGWQLHHHPVPLSCNLGTLTSWNPLGHSRSVTGLLYLYLFIYSFSVLFIFCTRSLIYSIPCVLILEYALIHFFLLFLILFLL
jgi:hypothetical protein